MGVPGTRGQNGTPGTRYHIANLGGYQVPHGQNMEGTRYHRYPLATLYVFVVIQVVTSTGGCLLQAHEAWYRDISSIYLGKGWIFSHSITYFVSKLTCSIVHWIVYFVFIDNNAVSFEYRVRQNTGDVNSLLNYVLILLSLQ